MKQLAWYTTVALATILAVLLVWELRTTLGLFILSLTIAAVLRPIIDRLYAFKLPRSLAVSITYLVIIAIFFLLVLTLSGPFMSELQALTHDLPAGYGLMRTQGLTSGNLLEQSIANNLPDLNALSQMVVGGQWNVLIQNSLDITLVSLDMISKIVLTVVVSIYWIAGQEHIKRLWLSLLPMESRTRSRDIWQNIEREIGSYLRSELFQSLLTVILLAIGYQWIGLKYPVILALIGAVGWLIVWFGGLIAIIPALLAGFAISPLVGIGAVVYTIAVLAFLEFVVEPKLFNRHHFSSLLVVILVLIMVKEVGVIGFFLAPPLGACIQILARHLLRPKLMPTSIPVPPPPVEQIGFLRERLLSVKKTVAAASEPPSPEFNNLVQRLEELIEQANQEQHLAG